MQPKEMQERFEVYLNDPTSGSNIVDLELRKIVSLLGMSVLKLDDSSTKLARVNIRLTKANVFFSIVLIFIGLIQIILMLRGH